MLIAISVYLLVSYSITLYYVMDAVGPEDKLWSLFVVWMVLGPFMVPMVIFGYIARHIGV